jgi:hypothetical protein
VVIDPFEFQRDRSTVRRRLRDNGAACSLDRAAERDRVTHRREPVGALDEERCAIGIEPQEPPLDSPVLVPVEQVQVEDLLACSHQPHIQRLPAGHADGAEWKLERLARYHVRLVVTSKPGPLSSPQTRERVRAMRRHQNAVKPLVVVGTDAVVLVDLALLDERRRIEVGQGWKAIAIERGLEHQIALL